MSGSFRDPRVPPKGSPADVHRHLLKQRGDLNVMRVYQVDLAIGAGSMA